MAYTTAQRDALKAAIAQGALTVEYDGKRITYRSLDEMERVLRLMDAEIGDVAAPRRQIRVTSRKGL